MSEHLRFRVDVSKQWVVTIRRTDLEAAVGVPRTLGRLVSDDGVREFPLPPQGELDALQNGSCPLLQDATRHALAREQGNIVARRAARVADFGNYLFATLLGPNWEAIRDAAQHAGKAIELALCWEDDEHDLHRLNWELMHSGSQFLAATGVDHAAITRLVAGTGGTSGQKLGLPPKVLFVVSGLLSDPTIRPGAEIANLLRRLKTDVVQDRRMETRLIEQATSSDLEDAVKAFQPDVVHFICHGGYNEVSRGSYLELHPDEESDDGRRDATALKQSLAAGKKLPEIVVLSACHSAGTDGQQERPAIRGPDTAAPLAAQLVGAGIPIVVGMAGRVADRVCRLFTVRFGESILCGDRLVEATAHARRAGLARGTPAGETADWGFATVFMAEGVDPGYQPVATDGVDPMEILRDWVAALDLDEAPVFCGRDEFVRAFHRLYSLPGGRRPNKQVLALHVHAEGLGRTRLLKELAIHALRDGNVPVLVRHKANDAPQTLAAFAARVARQIARVRRGDALGLGTREGQLNRLQASVEEMCADDRLDVEIREQIDDNNELTSYAVRVAMQHDLEQLRKDARSTHEHIKQRKGRVVLLLDDVEDYGPLLNALFDREDGVLHAFGAGSSAHPVPVVLTLATSGRPETELLGPISEKREIPNWLEVMPLEPFGTGGEDMLAYEQVLLHPFKSEPKQIADRPWAFAEVESTVTHKWENLFHKWLQGVPRKLVEEDALYILAEWGAGEDGFVIDADDKPWLDEVPR